MQITGTFETRLAQLRSLEAKIKSVEDVVKVKLQPYKDAREKLRALLLEMLNQSGQDSAKTTAGTVYKTKKQSASLDDPDAFKRHVIGTESWDMLDWKANLTAALDFAEVNQGQLPPGVKLNSLVIIGVRAPVPTRKRKPKVTTEGEPPEEDLSEDQIEHGGPDGYATDIGVDDQPELETAAEA